MMKLYSADREDEADEISDKKTVRSDEFLDNSEL